MHKNGTGTGTQQSIKSSGYQTSSGCRKRSKEGAMATKHLGRAGAAAWKLFAELRNGDALLLAHKALCKQNSENNHNNN